jgi:HEAT repeat protein
VSETNLRELINILSDKAVKDQRREAAALALKSLGEEAILPLRELLQAGDADLRWWAARALAAIGGPLSMSLLIETLADSDPDVRACAALGLGEIGVADAAGPLCRALGDESAYVGRIASNALIQIGQAATPALIQALADKSAPVRAGAARALVPLESHDAIPALFAVLEDGSALVTHYAEEALWRMGVGMVLIKPG